MHLAAHPCLPGRNATCANRQSTHRASWHAEHHPACSRRSNNMTAALDRHVSAKDITVAKHARNLSRPCAFPSKRRCVMAQRAQALQQCNRPIARAIRSCTAVASFIASGTDNASIRVIIQLEMLARCDCRCRSQPAPCRRVLPFAHALLHVPPWPSFFLPRSAPSCLPL